MCQIHAQNVEKTLNASDFASTAPVYIHGPVYGICFWTALHIERAGRLVLMRSSVTEDTVSPARTLSSPLKNLWGSLQQ
jgi:hypothetical protein